MAQTAGRDSGPGGTPASRARPSSACSPPRAAAATPVALPAQASAQAAASAQAHAAALAAMLKIAPANRRHDAAPSDGITVTAVAGKVTNVTVRPPATPCPAAGG